MGLLGVGGVGVLVWGRCNSRGMICFVAVDIESVVFTPQYDCTASPLHISSPRARNEQQALCFEGCR
jgi:hypothetical protein